MKFKNFKDFFQGCGNPVTLCVLGRPYSRRSKRGSDSGIATITRGLYDTFWSIMKEGLKTYKPEVKASKLDKRLQSYGHLKFCIMDLIFLCRRLVDVAQTPTCKHFDIPAQ